MENYLEMPKSRHFWWKTQMSSLPAPAASKENGREEHPDDPVLKEICKMNKNLEEKIAKVGEDVAEIKHTVGALKTKVDTRQPS